MALTMLIAVGCAKSPEFPSLPSLPDHIDRVPGVHGRGDYITAVDLDQDAQGRLHILRHIYTEHHRSLLWYQQSTDQGHTWTGPMHLESAGSGRIVATPRRLHVLSGVALNHYVSDDHGRTWESKGKLIDSNQMASMFDVACIGETLVVAYVNRGLHESYVHVLRMLPGGPYRHEQLGSYGGWVWYGPGPRITLARNVLHLTCAVLADETTVAFHHWTSADGASTWSNRDSVRVPLLGQSGFGGVPDLACAPWQNGIIVFLSCGGIVGLTHASGRWSEPRLFETAEVAGPSMPHQSRIDVQVRGTRIALGFIDPRYERTERSWGGLLRNPLVALLGKDPDWGNNDTLVHLANTEGDPLFALEASEPRRLIQTTATAINLRLSMVGDDLFCLWSGKAKVLGPPGSYRPPDELLHTRLRFAQEK